MRGAHLTEAQLDALVRLHRAGATSQATAATLEKLDVSPYGRVFVRLRNFGLSHDIIVNHKVLYWLSDRGRARVEAEAVAA